jgi:hypothetical protein
MASGSVAVLGRMARRSFASDLGGTLGGSLAAFAVRRSVRDFFD